MSRPLNDPVVVASEQAVSLSVDGKQNCRRTIEGGTIAGSRAISRA
jgi:hypothetical protein